MATLQKINITSSCERKLLLNSAIHTNGRKVLLVQQLLEKIKDEEIEKIIYR